MINAKEFVKAFNSLEEAKNIPVDVIIDALKQALIIAYKQKVEKCGEALARVEIDEKKGTIKMFAQKNVVSEVIDDNYSEIALADAKALNPALEIGDVYETEVNIDSFQRAAALHVKQILKQRLREAEKNVIYDEYIQHKDDIIMGTVERIEPNYCLINIGKTNALLPSKNRIPNEVLSPGQIIKVYVEVVDNKSQGAQVIVSRTAEGFLRRLFESEIMEVYDGTVEVRKIARRPGERAKVAVSSRDPEVNAPTACIGRGGMRIQKITKQLANEKIDVIEYRDEPELFIAEALKPARVHGLILNEEAHSAVAIVANENYSLAIGHKGQNVSLAVKLTGWSIDIKTVDDALANHLVYKTIDEIEDEYVAKAAKEEETITMVEPVEETVITEKVVEAPIETVKPVVEEKVVVSTPAIEPVEEKKDEMEDMLAKMPTPKIKGEYIPVVEQTKPAEEVKRAPRKDNGVSKKALKKAEEEKAKAREEEAKKNYMPVYTEEELKAIQEEEKAKEKDGSYDEDLDYDDYDDYYDD